MRYQIRHFWPDPRIGMADVLYAFNGRSDCEPFYRTAGADELARAGAEPAGRDGA